MLVERPDVRQIPNEGFRRWFTDPHFDLIVWYEQDRIAGFQLCYDKKAKERAVTWRRDGGYSHHRIDDGEIPFGAKMTPILVADGVFGKDEVVDRFRQAVEKIDPEIVTLVVSKLKSYPDRIE